MSSNTSETGGRDDPRRELARRNARMAWFHVLLAASFLLVFFLMQAHR